MKLQEQKWTSKEGVEKVKYIIKKMNEFGEGITVDTKIDFKLQFPPNIKTIPFVDKKTKANKSFVAVNILAQPSVEFENVKLHPEYGSASFQLAEKYAEWIKDCQKGDVITVWLRSFEAQDGGKTVRRSTWDCNINGVNVKAREKVQEKKESQPIHPAVAAIFDKKIEELDNKNKTPEDKRPQIPAELEGWFKKIESNKENFIDVFYEEGMNPNNPTKFLQWIKRPTESETDWGVNKEDYELVVLYTAILYRLGVLE